jgi:hypothetical protein
MVTGKTQHDFTSRDIEKTALLCLTEFLVVAFFFLNMLFQKPENQTALPSFFLGVASFAGMGHVHFEKPLCYAKGHAENPGAYGDE